MSNIKIIISPLRKPPSPDLNGSLNFFIGAIEKDNNCIICLDNGDLVKNDRCSCIYHFHLDCIKEIEHPERCLLCKKEYTAINPIKNQPLNNEMDDAGSMLCTIFIFFILITAIIIGIYTAILHN